MGNSVLLENKPHIESIWQYIRIPSRIFFHIFTSENIARFSNTSEDFPKNFTETS